MSKPTRVDHGPVSPAQVTCTSIRPGRGLINSSGVIWKRTKYLLERSKTKDHRQLFSGIDYQAQVRIYADQIVRSCLITPAAPGR
jgi:hypothetical protein